MSVVEEKAKGHNTNFVSTVNILIQRFYLGNPWQCPIAIKNASIYLEPKRRIGLFQKNSLEVKGKNISQSLLGTLAWAIPPWPRGLLEPASAFAFGSAFALGARRLGGGVFFAFGKIGLARGADYPGLKGGQYFPTPQKKAVNNN